MSDFFNVKNDGLTGNSVESSRDGYSGQHNDEQQPRGWNNSQTYRRNYADDGQRNGNYNGQSRYHQSSRREGGFRPRFQSRNEQRDGGFRPRSSSFSGQGENPSGSYQPSRGYAPRSGAGGYSGGYRKNYNNYEAEGGDFSRQRPRFRKGESGGSFRPRTEGYAGSHSPAFSQRPRFKDGNERRQSFGKARARYELRPESFDPNEPLRLNKFLANAGVCSRRDADKYIEAGVVTVNGKVVTELGTKVLRTDEVRFHDEIVKMESKVYVLLNKPKGYVTTSEDPQNRKTVMDLVSNACPERIYPVGRLDRNTTGVLLLTNDGELASKLTHPKFEKKKIYHVYLDQNVTAADLRKIADGIELEDGFIKADEIEYASDTDKKQVGIQIHSGKNRIVRRIFESLGYHVVKLDRVFFAGLTKKKLRRGDWRYLTEQEVNFLRMGSFE